MCKSKHKLAISNQLLLCNVDQSFSINRTSYVDREARKKSSYDNVEINCLHSLLKKARIFFENKSNY